MALLAFVVGCAQSVARPAPVGGAPPGTMGKVCPSQRVETEAALQALAQCTVVKGDLIVHGTNIASLGRLSRLRSIRGRLVVTGNAQLRTLVGLENLTEVRALVLRESRTLTSLEALSHLSAAGSIALEGLPALESATGLERVETLRELSIRRTGLATLRGFEGLRSVQHLRLEGNPKLVSVRHLAGIERVESIEIRDSPLLYGGPEEFFPRLTRAEEVVLVDNEAISTHEAQAFTGRVAMRQPAADERYAGR